MARHATIGSSTTYSVATLTLSLGSSALIDKDILWLSLGEMNTTRLYINTPIDCPSFGYYNGYACVLS
jgi:hypothetical protein